MTQQPEQAAATRTFQLQPQVKSDPNHSVIHVNTYAIAFSQNLLYIDFASYSPLDFMSQENELSSSESELVRVVVPPQVRLALPLQAAYQLGQAIQQQIAQAQAQVQANSPEGTR